MKHRVVGNPIITIPGQVILSLVIMEYRAVIMMAQFRVVVRLYTPLLEVQRFDGQLLERDVN